MKTGVKTLVLAAISVSVLAQQALAWRASNWHDVYPLGNGVYEVVSEPGSGPVQFWCAIADYALRQDRVAANQRIYVHEPVGPSVNKPGYKAVRFSYVAPAGADTSKSWSISVDRPGKNLSAAAAVQYCRDEREDAYEWELN